MKFELKQHFQIESARFLPHLEKTHPCSRMHGHSFKIVLTLVDEADAKLGWVIDYNEIQAKMKPILDRIDHRVLNEVPGLENPTSELLTKWVFDQARAVLPALTRVTIAETPATECSYPA
jgi:6-pyruvoyltetrahydropterin/6-carboxytetrahydropterin synthase